MRRYTGDGSFGSVEKKENKTTETCGARPAYKDSFYCVYWQTPLKRRGGLVYE